jgi:hypothetical protein
MDKIQQWRERFMVPRGIRKSSLYYHSISRAASARIEDVSPPFGTGVAQFDKYKL